VWSYFLSRRADFTNDQYEPIIDDHIKGRERLVIPKLSDVRWWHQVFNRTDEEMNSTLHASAAAAERVAAYSSGTATPVPHPDGLVGGDGAGSPRRSPLPLQPPGLASSRSVLTGVEAAQASSTPGSSSPPLLKHSSSTGEMRGAIAKLQERVAGLGVGRGVFGGNNSSRHGRNKTSIDGTERELEELGDQELQSMG
jgi:myotubularin-related protein 6/7/8